ncbi:hypothetical protein [Methylobacterium sp. Leaf118]|uniref:hypothetical protein n=1 Tax=Methylobacterium sp. Leaf118 TaxID=2876562 RepID=UPI001E486136|nr:hypothetical protein [Methylobacterium sp. Leaf118]
MRTTTLTLATALALGLGGGALAQGATAPGSPERGRTAPGPMPGNTAEAGPERSTGPAPAGNPTQDTTGAIGHPKSTNSTGSTTAPAAR